MTGSPSAHRVGQQAQEARPLDRLRELALLARGDRGDAARHDLAALRDEALQQLHVLVVDLGRIRAGERTRLASPEERPAGGCSAAAAVPIAATLAAAFSHLAHAAPPAAAAGAGASASRGSRSP